MRRAFYTLGLLGIVIGALMVGGCGSTDLMDEKESRYTITMEIEDANEETLAIDVVQDNCSDDPEKFDPEPYTDAYSVFTVRVAANTAGLTLASYEIDYIPVKSADGTGHVVTPPSLASPGEMEYDDFSVPTNSSGIFTILCLTVETKDEYMNKLLADPALDDFLFGYYIIEITLNFIDEGGNSKEMVVNRTVTLGWYNNC